MNFETYTELVQHKSQCHQKKTILSCTSKKVVKPQQVLPEVKLEPEEVKEGGFGQDFMELVSNAIDTVPETTFNNMHGTIRHIHSTDGQLYQSKEGKLGTVERVKLNVSDFWSRKNVWESGWEPTPTNSRYVFIFRADTSSRSFL